MVLHLYTLYLLANKALFVLMKKITYLQYPRAPLYLMYKLFEALIIPILEYGCQIRDFQATSNNDIYHN